MELSGARYKNLRYIQRNWELSDEELSLFFKVDMETIEEWHQRRSLPQLKSLEELVEDLMDIYERATAKYQEETVSWLVEPVKDLDGLSPLQALLTSTAYVPMVKMLLTPT